MLIYSLIGPFMPPSQKVTLVRAGVKKAYMLQAFNLLKILVCFPLRLSSNGASLNVQSSSILVRFLSQTGSLNRISSQNSAECGKVRSQIQLR